MPKYVIVGGGVAGLYAAWRLAVDAKVVSPSDIVVLEGSARTGGRLYTQPLDGFVPSLPSVPTVRAELGGMRFLNYHLYVGYLAQHLGLTWVPFPADTPENWHYLRTSAVQSFSNQDTYHLAQVEQEVLDGDAPPVSSFPPFPQTPGGIVGRALAAGNVIQESWLPNSSGTTTLRDMVNNILAVPGLSKQGFWNLVVGNGTNQNQEQSPQISNEAYEMFADEGAYDTVPANWNAAAAVVDMAADFATDPTYFALTDGYESLPAALAQSLQAAGVQVLTQCPVTTVEKVGNSYSIAYQSSGQSTPQIMTADNLILALPPRAIELMMPVSPVLQSLKPQLLQASPVPLFKIFLVYQNQGTQPWWSSFVQSWDSYTRMTTDLPMRQIYNFGSYVDSASGLTYTLVQASYSDGLKAGYWAGLLSQEDNQSIDTDIFANVAPATGQESLGTGIVQWNDGSPVTDHPLFSTVHSQFVTMLNAIAPGNTGSIPQPMAGAAIDWATDPFGGGVNFWNVGVDVNSAYNSTLNLVAANNGAGGLYIVGEGYSLLQGWVEGALWSVEDAMAKAFPGWTQPSWLSTTPLGPS